jgi:hypothetical protein
MPQYGSITNDMKQYKVITYKKLYPYGRPSQMKIYCDVCSRGVEHGKTFVIIDNEDILHLHKAWVCSKRCVTMYILSNI